MQTLLHLAFSALAALLSLAFLIAGALQMSQGRGLTRHSAMVRQTRKVGLSATHAVLTLNSEDDVVHVDCRIPGGWLSNARPCATDMIHVRWKKGATHAVAERTIQQGCTMLLIGAAGLALSILCFLALL